MDKLKQLLPIKINSAWPILWTVLYLCILIFGAAFPTSVALTLLKLLGIALCLVYVALYFKTDRLLLTAFALTLLADILLAINNISILGVFSFCFAQFTHLYRLSDRSRSILILLISAAIVLPLALVLLPSLETIFIFGATYAIVILANLFLALDWRRSAKSTLNQSKKRPNQTNLFFARSAILGFALFICCDICVLLSFAANLGAIPASAAVVVNYLTWVFYYPSQILISHSSKSMVK